MNRLPLFVRRAIALFVITSLLPLPALAQVIASPTASNANRPNVSQTANGLPIVNIATPNAAGVSSNLYQQYNVGSQGLILNNAQGNTQTQLAGYVAGNPYLASGSARIILNQVVGGPASQLQGYTEVAGQQAQVVVANPAGIFCNGCGFINTSRSVLTTGTPIFGGSGSLDAFHVTGGQIQIGANGLNGSNIDQVDLIARSVQINGKLWANRALNVVAGANDVQYADLSATALTPDSNRPAVAIDVGALGGMYAGKIALIGTEAGVGVNSAGTIEAQAGDLQLSSEGKVTFSGVTSATGNISASGSSLNMAGAKAGAKGDATLTATGAGGDTGNVDLTGAALIAGGSLSVNAKGALTNDQAQTSAAQLSVNAARLSNRGGMLSQTGTGDMTLAASGAIDNTTGTITSNAQNVAIRSANLTNTNGQISHAGTGTLDIRTGALDNNYGSIATNGSATVAVDAFNNTAGSLASTGSLGITATGSINNSGGTLSGATLNAAAASLTNVNGAISASSVAVTVPQLDNSNGQITGNQVTIGATRFTNAHGTLTQLGSGAMTLGVTGTLDNANGGVIQTKSMDLTLSSAAINNNGGTITHAGTGTLTINPGNGAGALTNVGGRIVTNGQASVSVASLDNTGGSLASQGAMSVNTQAALTNVNGKLSSGTALTVTSAGALRNAGGVIGAGGAVTTSTLDVTAASIDNAGGAITNVGTGATTIDGGSQIANSNASATSGMGSISGNGDVTLNATSISNTQGGQISGANLQIGTTALDNTGGAIGSAANMTGDIGIAATTLTATNGKIGASRDLVVTTNTLLGSGQYSAVNDLTLNLQGSFAASASDTFNAGHNLTFTLPGTFSNAGAFVVANGLTIHAGDIANSGLLNAGGLLTTSSRTLTNTGSIVGGSVSLTATQTLSNLGTRALIGATDSAGKLELLAPDIENRDDVTATDAAASTTIYGLGQVVLAGSKDASGNYSNANLVRNQSALIQSGGNMQIAANQVTNTRRVMATGGFTSSVDPSVLDALGISMSGCTAMQMQACSGQAVGWTIAGDPTLIGGAYTQPPHGDQWNSGYQYTTYTGVAVANTVTSISPESQIISGGNLNAGTVGTFQNYWSKVAASGSIASPVTLDQNSWQGQSAPQVQVTYSGQYHYNNYDDSEHNWQLPFGDAPFVGSRPGGYTQAAPADVRTYALPAYESSFTAGTTLSGTGTTINNSAGNASIPSLGLQPGQTVTGQNGALDTANLANLKNPTVARATAGNVLTNLTLPKGGLFNTDTAPNAPYLVETNPAFTNQKQWLSSDYYFQQMGMNPGQIQLRLGDGFYEQKLVQDQIMSLTGKSVLTNYADTQAEFQALMTSGAQLAKSLDLAPGMGLSADQVAQLTSNVVIMQDQVVDGQTVLVPVVYLAQASQQNMGNGPVIAATDIDLQNAKTVSNSGTITASNNFSVSAQSIDSSFGALQAGKQLAIATTGDVNLTSATVNAGSLALQAGGDLILNTAANTVSQVSSTGATRVTTTLGPTASINVAGDAAIVTGGDFDQNAGNLDVGGALGLSVGGNWNLGVQQTGETKAVERANGVSDTHLVSDVGSSVKVGGASTIAVGGDLTATGASIDLGGGGTIAAMGNVTLQAATATSTVDSNDSGSGGGRSYSETLHRSDDAVTGTTLKSGDSLAIVAGKDLNVIGSTVDFTKGAATLMAAGNVNIGAATETHVSELQGQGSHGGALSHTSQEDRVDQATQTADASTISADSVSIVSGHDINVTGSNIVATNNVALGAKGSVNILAATDTYQDSEFHDVKHSGFSGTGGLGVSYGSSEQKDQYTANSVTQSQSRSTVGSVQGNVSIAAGQNVHIGGSDIVAGKAASDTTGTTGNIAIQAQNITIDPSQDTANSHDQQDSHSSGISVGINGTPLDTIRNLKDASSSGNAYSRANGIGNEIGASSGDVPSVSMSFGSQSSSSTSTVSSTTQSGSTIRGGGNVTLNATGGALLDANSKPLDGDITVIGSTISGGGTTTLAANRNVTLEASTDQWAQSNASSSSSTSFQVAAPSPGDFGRWVSGGPNNGGVSASPYNASSSNANGNSTSSQQTASVVTGNSVIVSSKTGDINVIGSGISGVQGVDLIASQGAINVLAGLDTSTNHQEQSSHQFGDLGSNGTGTGFTVGVANSHQVQDSASQTQGTIRSQIVSGNGSVTLDASKDITVKGSDVSASGDLTLIGQNLNLDPGSDATQDRMSQSASQFGVTLALGGIAGNAAATINQSMEAASKTKDSRLAALDIAQAGLTAYGAEQGIEQAVKDPDVGQPLVKVTVSVGGGSSHSESQSSSVANDGSTLNASGTVTLVATGSGKKDSSGYATDGDISAVGTQISGTNVVLNAARDINLQSAQDTSQQKSDNSSSNASIGVGMNFGGEQNGFTIELAASASKGNVNGNSVTNRDTTVSASDTLTITSGRDTNVRGAEASGNTIDANVGRDLNIASLQDTNTYDSKQTSAGFQASLCIPPICYGTTVSGSVNFSQQSIKDNFQSVVQQSGLYAGDGGFNVNVGNHTQLDGGVIASTADADKNSLSTQTFGYSNLQNSASYSGSSIGFSASGSGGKSTPDGMSFPSPAKQAGLNGAGPLNSQGLGPSGFGAAGVSDNASGTTYAAISAGTITVRGDAGTGQDSTAGLSRDTANANGAVKNTFDAQAMQDDMAVQQQMGQVGMQAAGDVADHLKAQANRALDVANAELKDANASGDSDAIAQAQADLDAANQRAALWAPDGAGRTTLHAAVAGAGAALGGGNVLGAVGGTIAGDVAADYAGRVFGDGLPGTLLTNIAAGAAGALAGGAISGVAGALSGANGAESADLYNRQLHPDEKQRIHDLANGDPGEEARLSAAACALVHCSAEYPVGSVAYSYYSALEALGNSPGLSDERSVLTQQSGLFIYTSGASNLFSDANIDAAKRVNNTYQVVTRGLGLLQALEGAAVTVSGAAITAGGAASCPETGVGCVVAMGGAALTGWGLDQSKAGVTASIDGQPQSTIGAAALQNVFGISSAAAELLYGMVGGVAGIASDVALAGKGGAAAGVISRQGRITVLTGATPDANELRAGQGLADLGLDVSHQPTASSLGIDGQRTADLLVKGVGQVDVYTPKQGTSVTAITRAIEGKADQANGVFIQADLPPSDMAAIAARTWGKPTANAIQTLFFQSTDGSIIRFNRPV